MNEPHEPKSITKTTRLQNALQSRMVHRMIFGALALLCIYLVFAIPDFFQVQEGKKLSRWAVYVKQMLPIAFLIDGLILIGICCTVPWWFRKWETVEKLSLTPHPFRRTHYILLAAIMLFSIVSNAPRLTQSLWGDEEFTLRHNVVGEYRITNEGAMKFYQVTWGQSLWSYISPNNHGFFSLLSKASHNLIYREKSTPEALYFSELAMRMPSFLAGLLALFLVYQLMSELGFARSGIIAVALLSLHPWFVRYSTEARGYALLFALWPLALLVLLRGLRTGAWHWWLAFGLCQWLLLSTWMLQIHWVLAMNVAALVCLWNRRDDPHRVLLRRWLLGGIIGALLTLPTLLPAIPQIQAWMKDEGDYFDPSLWHWCREATSWLLTGQSWITPEQFSPYTLGRDLEWRDHGYKLAAEFIFPAAFLLGGIYVLLRKPRQPVWILIAMLLPLVTLGFAAWKGGGPLLTWYASPFLPACLMLISLGIDRVARVCSCCWQIFAIVGMIVICGMIWAQECRLLRTHDFEPTAEATRLTRRALNPKLIDLKHDPITVQFCLKRKAYDPACELIDSADELQKLITMAKQEQRPLFVHLGDVNLARMNWPEIMKLVDNKNLFEDPTIFYGMEYAQTRLVWKLK